MSSIKIDPGIKQAFEQKVLEKYIEMSEAVEQANTIDLGLAAENNALANNRIERLKAAKVKEKEQSVQQEEIGSELKQYSDGTLLSDQWPRFAVMA
jgi:regulator of PEP synthase PpsR (kinase-PPPase family)